MSDGFDSFLHGALEPVARAPDRRFVARVQARIAVEAHLRAQRRGTLRQLAVQLVGIVAVAAGLVWFGRAESVGRFFGESPAWALCAMLSLFALMLVLFTSQKVEQSRA